MIKNKKRSKYEIYMDVLEAIASNHYNTITRISYRANMPLDRTKEIIELMKIKGFIREEDFGGRKRYHLTALGGELLHALKTVKRYLEET
ncbi:MAG: winged helix-turn-helix domain-containing protein [Candidatus Methanomethylicia archaeon]